MGGQMDYFGLYVHDSFDGGHCRGDPSTTFGNAMLSGKEEYEIESVEVWIVKQKVVSDEEKGSVLENTAASQLLEMSGRKMYSKDLARPIDRKRE
jgi:hypothetical protein